MTQKLYNENSYLTEFDAVVTQIDGNRIVLDKTAFFPEGGGQSSDKGTINSIRITDVQEENGIIYHYTDENHCLKEGDKIHGSVDFTKRFSDMQQHSGEHIVSGVIHNMFSLENIGFHLGQDAVTLDFGKVFSKDEINLIEEKANDIVFLNKKINITFPSPDELKEIPYRSKKELTGEIRIVEIEDVDICACCAPHVNQTGEVGLIKIVNFEKHRGGTRIYILCGKRALIDYRKKQEENHTVSVLLKAKEYETSQAVEQLLKRKNDSDYEIIHLKEEIARISAENIKPGKRIIAFTQLSGTALTRFADTVKDKAEEFAAVFSKNEDGSYQFVIGSNSIDVREIGKKMQLSLSSRGGGKPQMIQGSVKKSEEEIQNFLLNLD